jgi:hypothetical protein
MPIHYRLIKYQTRDQEGMDDQLNRSLAEGIHHGYELSVSVKDLGSTIPDPSVMEGLKSTNQHGMISKQDLEKLKKEGEEEFFNSQAETSNAETSQESQTQRPQTG